MQKHFESVDKEVLSSDDYEFIAYDYGPFSKELYEDLDSLSDQNQIEDSQEELSEDKVKYIYSIQRRGEDLFETQLNQEEVQKTLRVAEEIKEEYNDMLLSQLIEEVYARYPNYAKNSIY
ncbi:type II toxin-antitoxin system antitoxin SocA domain-containing protein [Haloprofundus sp. MHR1]|uniref:type II toxin-antitoxin system antitoxin SocA domain-containing protein n=1 Tax=Haloprofundus sp. MHR1 TaxID=2572921 RepID=UPI00143CC54A|nr:type II toxin-antitoxin system antitoxin SocA domain-containing protein [Haloprofundus sp. MHR1]